MSSHEVGFNLRGTSPLSQNFARWASPWEEMFDLVISYTAAVSDKVAADKDDMGQPEVPHVH